jgi:hypothetical protein
MRRAQRDKAKREAKDQPSRIRALPNQQLEHVTGGDSLDGTHNGVGYG